MTNVLTAKLPPKALCGEITALRAWPSPQALLTKPPLVISTTEPARTKVIEMVSSASFAVSSGSDHSLSDIYSREDILRLWDHQSNGNGDGRYVLCFTKGSGFYREKHKLERKGISPASLPFSVERLRGRMRESYRSALGKSKPTEAKAIAHYPTGLDGKTTWIACDFDAHQGEWDRAERFVDAALASSFSLPRAFTLPETFRVSEQTGGGFRLTILFREPVDWATAVECVKFIQLEVGCPIEDGVAEFFPTIAEYMPEYGKACRVVGSFHPKRGVRSIVRFEDVEPLVRDLRERYSVEELLHLPEDKRNRVPLEKDKAFGVWLEGGAKDGESKQNASIALEKIKTDQLKKYPIRPSKRNSAMKKLVGSAFEMMGEAHVIELVQRQYDQGQTDTDQKTHLQAARAMIQTCNARFPRKLNAQEKDKFNSLSTDAERDCFRILRGWWNKAKREHRISAQLAAYSMAERLGVSRQAVDQMRQRFEEIGILKAEKTKKGYFFRWLLDESGLEKQEKPSEQSSDNPF
jgi:hypothetical protein